MIHIHIQFQIGILVYVIFRNYDRSNCNSYDAFNMYEIINIWREKGAETKNKCENNMKNQKF